MDQIIFTIPEVIALIGVFQCVYVLVYVTFRAGDFVRVILPVLYFFVLGLAFFIDLARGYISEITQYYEVISWASWSLGTPLSVLLIVQMSHITKLPSLLNWVILLVVPFALAFAIIVSRYVSPSCQLDITCPELFDWLQVFGLIAGAVSLLAIWGHRSLFSDIIKQKAGKDRYWLVLSLIIVNIAFLALGAFGTGSKEVGLHLPLIRGLLGLSFVYLVSTSLFRIYPQALLVAYKGNNQDVLSNSDIKLVEKINNLLDLDKIYHEPTYSRSDLARELECGEATISRIININFKKSFTQLLNERRIEYSKILLLDTDASIKIISQDVGFNSLASFNRVFKEMVGQSPSNYRSNIIK